MTEKNKKVFFTLREAAEYLNEAEATVRDWVARRIIPHYKRGRRLQFNIEEIIVWDRRRNYRPTLEERMAGNAKR